ncbi:MAG: 16S rRNA (adenine(1518)-N(6)/adenine(1519)-N(6))-dimethyltransferase RsmA [Candidatus Gribaldobacteria bacterium]|nr:16S rRNA (adenine(1518)-N(6)/adenine(1519)-N(6))-dimethyltransferase RsmA [Candidatus Gribaldobacteria bacterium]
MHKPIPRDKSEILSNKGVSPIRPIKALGQNFLRYEKIVWQVIKVADLKPSDTVIEVGPGRGALTFKLAQKADKVIAIEKDRQLAKFLQEKLSTQNIKNVEIINKDILNYQFNIQNYKVVANLPYNIATAVIMKFLQAKNPPELMTVITQKEIGQKIVAKPPEMSKLSVFSQLYSDVKIIDYISRKCFYPQPKVDGAILLIQPKKIKLAPKALANFTRIARAGFVWPRKQLANNLSKGLDVDREKINQWLKQNQILPTRRPETLTVEEWIKLTATFV